jgi:toxin ParE1/3/4
VLSAGAAADLREIASYTLNQWGLVRCKAYIANLEKRAQAVGKGEGVFQNVGYLLPDLRVVKCGKHYIFCMPQVGKQSVILAILHERMDLMMRLQDRLQ